MTASSLELGAPATITWRQLTILVVARLIFATSFRVVYALIPILAAGLAVDVPTASLLVTVQVAAAMASPLGGALADGIGERATLLVGLGLFVAGSALCAIAGAFPLFLAGYTLTGLGSALGNPAIQTFASNRSPYARRGRVLGILEISWALAALVGVSALVWLVSASGGWSAAYWLMAGLGGAALLVTALALPATPPAHRGGPDGRGLARLDRAARVRVAGVLAFAFCALAGVELVFIVYASWLQADFGATTAQLGLIYASLGFVELGGSIGSTLFVDRLGKRRAVLAAFGALALLQLLLPLSAGSWWLFLPLFLLLGLTFEFGIVSLFPLVSGLAPAARGMVMALVIAAVGLGRVAGSLVGPGLWAGLGFGANGIGAALLTVVGLALCWAFVHEGEGAAARA